MTPLDPLAIPLCGTNLIEASAGTGKTYAITSLYVRLLLERQLSVSQILVVTYTNAATAELRARIRRRLREALNTFDAGASQDEFLDQLVRQRREQGTLVQDRAQLVLALHSFDEAAIFTIHGFCQRMLQENAFESGMPFDTELVTNESPLLTEVVQDFWVRELHAAPQGFVSHLAHEHITPTTLENLAIKVITHPTMSVLPERHDPVVRAAELPAEQAPAAHVLKLQLDLADYARGELRRRKELTRVQSFDDLLHRLAEALRGPAAGVSSVARSRWSLGAAESDRPGPAAGVSSMARSRWSLGAAESDRPGPAAGVSSVERSRWSLGAAKSDTLLAETIRRRFRAALIDEFQDTDPVQYEIFRRVYLGSDAVLFLIGDPKQAIYAFRGADVFAYMQAKHDVGGDPHTLGINRRSDPSLIKGVSTLFGRLRAPFVFDEIPFLPVAAAPDAGDRLRGAGAGQAALQILFVRRTGQEGKGGAINKEWGEDELTRAVAADIVRFLGTGATIGDRRVAAGDIAVLCRKNKQAAAMQQALRALGVPSVLQGDASVFEADEAAEMERVLRALADPGDARALRAALSTTLLGQNAADLAALEHDEQRWDDWVQQFHAWHERWTQRGFVAGFRALLDARDVSQNLLGFFDGERRLTNVLHLLELLHTASTEERRGPHALVHWLHQMRTDADARAALTGEAAQIRLESDAAAVTLTTVHKSKGLQYPIVYCPYLWDGALLNKADEMALRFHDPADAHRLTLDIGSSDYTAHRLLAEHETFAENLRLLYVALTRAQHRCTVVWGAFRSAESSALGYVLHQQSAEHGNPRSATTERIKTFIKSRNDQDMRADLDALAAMAPGCIAVTDLSSEPAGRYSAAEEETPELHCRTATQELRRTWRVSSFSELASSGGTISQPAEEGLDHDASTEPAGAAHPAPPSDPSLVVLHEFPAGARAGQLVHEVLEKFDFQATDQLVLQAAVATALAHFGFEDKWVEPLRRAIADVVATPLEPAGERSSLLPSQDFATARHSDPTGSGRIGPTARGPASHPFCLRDIPLSRRLSELEFLFPVAGQEAEGAILTRERLADVFARHATAPLPADYTQRLRALGFAPFAGFLKGFIDLVFEHAGRWYVVDYKSNLLGARADDYRPEKLIASMSEHHYFLQYHLYVVALHRYLTRRLPGYHYDRHFGGVYYLFLRGMAPAFAPGNGVFVDRPSRPLIERLSAVLGPAGPAAGALSVARSPLGRSGLPSPKGG